jgi:DeoR/GlpR family transcriptional regulator of sugar metabolism
MIVAPLARIATLVTDDGATEDDLKLFRDAGINVVIAEVRPEDEETGERAVS